MSKTRKRIALGAGAAALIAAAGIGIWGHRALDTSRSAVADATVQLADVRSADRAAIRRGEYVMRAADCAACHNGTKGVFAGGYRFDTNFGTVLSSNITPDRKTGIGTMTERAFFNAVRHGQGSKGLLYPAMPYTAYARLTDRDMHDLWAYMSTVAPISNAVDENAGMMFPFNIRLALAGWDMLFFDPAPYRPTAGRSAEWERGRYLVDGGGHCSVCHSPRNMLGAEKQSRYLEGARIGFWHAPDLTANAHVGLGRDTDADIVEYLKTGGNRTAIAAGPMAEVVEHSLQYLSDADLTAMAIYLKSLPASNNPRPDPIGAEPPAMKRAALRYEVNCSACHGVRGEGMGDMVPPFAGNQALQSADASSLIQVMLVGGRAASTHHKPTGAGMPSFAWKMDDRQIAETLDYVRNSWGNAARPVREADVARMRKAASAATSLPAN
ncbi:c-type cytochrome [Sphingomonas sp. AP4-R1]|uniref:c-type cytochrome n=1 Tax=Sphingomonas sp. AP4-R1 TaxID=2735134 RepID=UPI00149340DE|nr:c-type cytochrome [Sphingomonas sp. AP4-R1]QJU57905.1 c-type cytochrome [Sphingomonas sp. AP4-R1]